MLTRRAGEASDTPAINRFLKAGGGELTGGPYFLDGPAIYWSYCRLDLRAKLIARTGWSSGHMIISAATTGLEALTGDIVLDFTHGGSLELPATTGWPFKGIGLRKVRQFLLKAPRVTSGQGNLFTLELLDAIKGRVEGGTLTSTTTREGGDGGHFTYVVEDVVFFEVTTNSADDAVGMTGEQAAFANGRLRKITFLNCVLRNRGHSSVKMLILPLAGAFVIEDITFDRCRFPTIANGQMGAPFVLMNEGAATGGIMRRILIDRSEIEVTRVGNSIEPLAPVIQIKDAQDVRFRRSTVPQHLSRQLLVARGHSGQEPIWDASNKVVPLLSPAQALADAARPETDLERFRRVNGIRVSLPATPRPFIDVAA